MFYKSEPRKCYLPKFSSDICTRARGLIVYNLDDKLRRGSGHPARFERRKNPGRHVYITGKNSVVPSRIEKSFSPAVYIFHAIFQNPSRLSLSLSLPCPFSYILLNREDSQIPKTPQSGDPRSSAPTTRIQIRKLSLSFYLAASIVPFLPTHEGETKSEEYQRKEKRGDVCASIYDVRWIGARASTLVTILMRLLYDVTFNGASRPFPSSYNSPAGPSGFFSLWPSTNREKSKRSRFHESANANFTGVDPFDEGIVLRNCGF